MRTLARLLLTFPIISQTLTDTINHFTCSRHRNLSLHLVLVLRLGLDDLGSMGEHQLDELDPVEADQVEKLVLQIIRASAGRQELHQREAELGQRHAGWTLVAVEFLEIGARSNFKVFIIEEQHSSVVSIILNEKIRFFYFLTLINSPG